DNIKQELKSQIHPNDMYSSKSINTRKITDALKSISISKIAVSQRIESVEIVDD
ncbi:15267_t:CDS:1, partial [Gigaspora margarita]